VKEGFRGLFSVSAAFGSVDPIHLGNPGWNLDRERNVAERLVGRLKDYRRVATRYDKLAASCLAFVQLAAIRLWL
jgi:Transposase DDE domain